MSAPASKKRKLDADEKDDEKADEKTDEKTDDDDEGVVCRPVPTRKMFGDRFIVFIGQDGARNDFAVLNPGEFPSREDLSSHCADKDARHRRLEALYDELQEAGRLGWFYFPCGFLFDSAKEVLFVTLKHEDD